mgnify:CR=1 FL=1
MTPKNQINVFSPNPSTNLNTTNPEFPLIFEPIGLFLTKKINNKSAKKTWKTCFNWSKKIESVISELVVSFRLILPNNHD